MGRERLPFDPSIQEGMAKNESKVAAPPPVDRIHRTPLVLSLVVIAIVVVAYLGYYRKRSAYITGRNLRLLSMVSGQIEERLALFGPEGLNDAMRPLEAHRVGDIFDAVLVADSNGNIVRLVQPPPSTSSLLYREDDSDDEDTLTAPRGSTRSPLLLNNVNALMEKKFRGDPAALKAAELTEETDHADVTFDGESYVLFSQPLHAPKAFGDGKLGHWAVCGLISTSRFKYEVMTMGASVVLLAIAVVLLAICCWPFLRIALIDPAQALTIGDVVMVAICTIVGAAVLTIAIYDAFAYRTMSRRADAELERFAERLNVDFAENVARAMRALKGLEPALNSVTNGQAVAPAADSVKAYPYIDSVMLLDAKGTPVTKIRFLGSHIAAVDQFANESDRRYFQDAKRDYTWKANGEEYVLQWVQLKTTGRTRAVVARYTGNAALPVSAMATDIIDVSHPVGPPGVGVAIIDENGTVVYHSDNQRIGFENFFAETDRNRDLRAAVLARRAGIVGGKYWGEDTSMYVRPLQSSPWTLVTFRPKRLTRVLNIEGALLTLMMLVAVALPYVIVYVVVLVALPGYRAPRLWPAATHAGDYLRIAIILIALLLLFWMNNYVLDPWSSFAGAALLPLIAIVSTYVVLHRAGAPHRFAAATALLLILYAVYLLFIARGKVDSLLFFSPHPRAVRIILSSLAVSVAILTFVLVRKHLAAGWARKHYAALYELCGVLLLVTGVVMPVAGFFTISRHVESQLLCRYGQLRAASDLEHRIAYLEHNIAPVNSGAVLGDLLYPLVKGEQKPDQPEPTSPKEWALTPAPSNTVMEVPGKLCSSAHADQVVPPIAAKWLPVLYEDSVAIRPLIEAKAADNLWFWCVTGREVKLVRNVRFDPPVAQKLWGGPKPAAIVVLSDVPQGAAPWSDHLLLLLAAVPLLAIFWYATHFIATRVLLIDLDEPKWMSHLPLSPTLGDHIFLVRRGRDIKALTGPEPAAEGTYRDVSFAALDDGERWDEVLETLDSSDAGQNVRITDFEYGIHDGGTNDKKLRWLERLMALPDRTVIIVSTVSRAFVMTTPPPFDVAAGAGVLSYYGRWRALLDRFVSVTADDLELRHEAWERQQKKDSVRLNWTAPTWLQRETEYDPFLRKLRDEVAGDVDRAHLIDEIGERAETYYAGLWSNLRDDEKLLLLQLARNGLANGRNRRVLRRLIARGLVRRDPNVELFSETFRRYVLEAARRENLAERLHALRPPSQWDALRVPFFVLIVAFLLLLFYTQKDLMTTTTALVTAMTTGLPMLMKLLGALTEKRMDVSSPG